MDLSARGLWFGRRRNHLCSAVEIPDTHQPVFCVAAPVETFCSNHCSFAWFKTPSATNALTVGEPQTWSPIVFLDSERRPQLTLRQVDPLIRELTEYRDFINLKTQEPTE